VSAEFYLSVLLVGFVAELVDSTFGMAYGVTSNSFLLSLGLAPAIASATIHQSEVFLTLASGVSHLKAGNVDKRLFRDLVVSGCAGGVLGALILSSAAVPGISTLVSFYLVLMGLVIILRAFGLSVFRSIVDARLLGFLGGLLDAIGGGGWGPVVTSTLVANGNDPKRSVGSVNLSEFFVTVSESLTFAVFVGFVNLELVLALLAGGLVAAPLGAYLCKRLPSEKLLVLLGLLLVVINLKKLLQL